MADARCETCGRLMDRRGIDCVGCRMAQPIVATRSLAELRDEDRKVDAFAVKVQRALRGHRCPEPRRAARSIARALLGPRPAGADVAAMISSVAGIDAAAAQSVIQTIEGMDR